MDNHVICKWRQFYFFGSLIWIPVIFFFPCLNYTWSSDYKWWSWTFLPLSWYQGENIQSFTTKSDDNKIFHYVLPHVERVPFYSWFAEKFYQDCILDFIRIFGIFEMIMIFHFKFIKVVNYNDGFLKTRLTFLGVDKYHLSHCCGMNYVSTRCIFWSPNPQ